METVSLGASPASTSATQVARPAGDVCVVNIENLSIGYGEGAGRTEILRGLNLEIHAGEFLAIVGASGVGKSTLLRILMGLAKPTQGRFTLARAPGFDVDMAMVFQDARLLPWRRILDNVAFGLERLSLSARERKRRAQEMLALVGLKDLAQRYPHQLSGGQRQRVALARALAVRPAILLMDEPFSALDIGAREFLQDEISRLHAATGATILFVTHDIDEAVYLADRIVALEGKPGEMRSDPIIDAARPRRRSDPHLVNLAADIKLAISLPTDREDWSI